MSAELLVELVTEELPPKALLALGKAFAEGVQQGLAARGLAEAGPGRLQVFAAPRRLGLLLGDVRAVAADRPFEQKLVPASVGLDAKGRPTPALLKKLETLGLPCDLERISREADAGKGAGAKAEGARVEILAYRGVRPGIALAEGLQQALLDSIARLPIPKVMNYQLADGRTTVQFVRPVQRLVALHGSQVVAVQALGLAAGRHSAGHRFLAPGALEIAEAGQYERVLRDSGKVLASFEARRARIVEQLQQQAQRLGARAVMPPELVDEVTALVEWPVVYVSEFDSAFLEVPQNCLVLTMQQNQKYFALQDERGRLLNRFLLVSNIEAEDPSAIVSGNARVVRARLADAKFFFDQDRQHRLETRLVAAAGVVYHRALGSLEQRIERLVRIAQAIAQALAACAELSPAVVARAALLAKTDLGTLMVGEFPELQGEMGGIYARAQGEPEAVAQAIEEHYRPRFAGDALPASAAGACLALADKLETLAGLFGAGERPSGDRDPFALRRNALGVLRILEERALPLELQALVALAFDAFDAERLPPGFRRCEAEVESFLYERLRGLLQEQGYGAREVDAVISLRPARIDRVAARMAAVRAFMQLPEAENLAAANKRIANLLRKSAPAAGAVAGAGVREELLFEPAERELAAAYRAVAPRVDAALAAGDDGALLRALTPLKQPVDRFFDEVMVLVDDDTLRGNRLALLDGLRAVMNRIADISLLAAG
jgi:glycyl-tRNA synthetase beta chain